MKILKSIKEATGWYIHESPKSSRLNHANGYKKTLKTTAFVNEFLHHT